MQTVAMVGLDIAKSVFQVLSQVVMRRQLKAALRPNVLREAAAVPDPQRSLRLIALLVAGALGARAPGALYTASAAALRGFNAIVPV